MYLNINDCHLTETDKYYSFHCFLSQWAQNRMELS